VSKENKSLVRDTQLNQFIRKIRNLAIKIRNAILPDNPKELETAGDTRFPGDGNDDQARNFDSLKAILGDIELKTIRVDLNNIISNCLNVGPGKWDSVELDEASRFDGVIESHHNAENAASKVQASERPYIPHKKGAPFDVGKEGVTGHVDKRLKPGRSGGKKDLENAKDIDIEE
jgi:hypothetical protein